MKNLSISSFLLLAVFQTQAQTPSYPTVLVELFSSEGCSSCLSADAFLNRIIEISDSTQSPVYCLDYHVDIWNRSGWVDRFSDTSFSRRQREYMVKSGQTALFTPMVFVNGQGGYPGGAKKDIGQAVNNELSKKPETQLRLKATYIAEKRMFNITYEVLGNIDSSSVNIALAHKSIKNQITGGENKDKTVVHHHTVIKWQRAEIDKLKTGTLLMQVPDELNITDLLMIGFIQHEPTWKIKATDQLIFR